MNNKTSNLSRLSYTSRDYASIFDDLVETIPSISRLWDSTDENDPGIVLVKLIAMLGDMLSYNQDRQALEVYPNTVIQRKNAAQIYNLIGYKMHWYRSAICTVNITNGEDVPITIPRFSKFFVGDGSICYTNVSQLEVPSNTTNNGVVYETELTQGIPITPDKASNDIIAKSNDAWHTIYGYNVDVRDIIEDRIYFGYDNVNETDIVLIDSTGADWIQTDNIDILSSTGKYFDFRVDEKDHPYIQLVNYWEDYNIDRFKLFYITSLGEDGEIAPNSLSKIGSPIVKASVNSDNRYDPANSDRISLTNESSSYGYSPETADEARKESKKHVNTYDTLITLDDFTRAVSRINGVAKCIAMDFTNAPLVYDSKIGAMTALGKYKVIISIVLTDEYEDVDQSQFTEIVQTALRPYKMIPLDIICNYGDVCDIKFCYWTVTGNVYLNNPVTVDKAQDILVKINNQLKYTYSASNVDFNKTIDYIDVIDTITNCDSLIHYVDIDQISYTDNTGQVKIPSVDVTGRYTYEVNPSNDYTYTIELPNAPITPGSVTIRFENNRYSATDNKNGKITDPYGVIRGYGIIAYNDEEIDGESLKAGTIKFETTMLLEEPIIIQYNKNLITITKYKNFSTTSFNIAPESIIQEV